MISIGWSEVVLGLASSGIARHDLRQAVEGDAGIQVMDVMIADVGREPGP